MSTPSSTPRSCRACGNPIVRTSRGRPPVACSPDCRRADRAATARTARAAARAAPSTPATAYGAKLAAHRALVERHRPRFVSGELERIPVRRLTIEERTALVALLDERDGPVRSQPYTIATYADIVTTDDGDVPPTLGDLGYGHVRGGRRGQSTIWASDPAQHVQARRRAREAEDVRDRYGEDEADRILAAFE